jgi:hypothetical protein
VYYLSFKFLTIVWTLFSHSFIFNLLIGAIVLLEATANPTAPHNGHQEMVDSNGQYAAAEHLATYTRPETPEQFETPETNLTLHIQGPAVPLHHRQK